jgi:hypothetical protein
LSCIPVRENKSHRLHDELRRIRLRFVCSERRSNSFLLRQLCDRHTSAGVESVSPLSVQPSLSLGAGGIVAMPLRASCDCPLCALESQLFVSLAAGGSDLHPELAALGFHSPASFLHVLRISPANAQSDAVLRTLFRLRAVDSDFVESLLVLAFVPTLHRTIRRVALYQPFLSEDDITQQALVCLLQVLRSKEMEDRKSHFAFAVSRAVKRRIFEWGRREGRKSKRFENGGESALPLVTVDNFERHAELHHFLSRCVQRGDLTDNEIDLLIRFKLEGTSSRRFLAMNGDSSNAVRQKMKRLLAKLRRLAM